MSFITKTETTALKGFAILLILLHHIYWRFPEYGFLNYIAVKARVGLAIFIILSGYGLSESLKKNPFNFKQFYKKRFFSIFPTYWFVFLVFIICRVNTFHGAYGVKIWPNFLINILGLQWFYNFYGYNPTWWYISLIIGLYSLFPLLYYMIRQIGIYGFFLSLVAVFSIDHFLFMYLGSFVLGICLSCLDRPTQIIHRFQEKTFLSILVLSSLSISLTLLRPTENSFAINRFDTLFGFILLITVLVLIRNVDKIKTVLKHFGNVSYEIFLSHGLVYYYVFWNFKKHIGNIFFALGMILLSYLLGVMINKIVHFVFTKPSKRVTTSNLT